MAVALASTTHETVTTTANNSSASINVPADCDCVFIGFGGYDTESTTFFSDATFTINSVGATKIRSDGSAANQQSVIYQLAGPSTGAQTLAWNFGGTTTVNEGTRIIIVYLKGVDPDTPVRSNGGEYEAAAGNVSTGNMAYQDGDMAVAHFGSYWNTASMAWTSATQLSNVGVYNSNYNAAAYAALSGAGNVNIEANPAGSDTGYMAISGAVVAAAAGGEPTGPSEGTPGSSSYRRRVQHLRRH